MSINTLLGSPRQLVCQCCGMPLEDDILGRDAGTFIEIGSSQHDQLAYLDGRAFPDFIRVGIILVNQVRKYKVFDQTGKRLTCNVLDGKKFVSHL